MPLTQNHSGKNSAQPRLRLAAGCGAIPLCFGLAFIISGSIVGVTEKPDGAKSINEVLSKIGAALVVIGIAWCCVIACFNKSNDERLPQEQSEMNPTGEIPLQPLRTSDFPSPSAPIEVCATTPLPIHPLTTIYSEDNYPPQLRSQYPSLPDNYSQPTSSDMSPSGYESPPPPAYSTLFPAEN